MLSHGDDHYLKKKNTHSLSCILIFFIVQKMWVKIIVAAVLCRVQSHPSVTGRSLKHQSTWVQWKFKLHQFKLTCQFLCNGNLKPQPQANKKFTKKCCVTVVFTNETHTNSCLEWEISTYKLKLSSSSSTGLCLLVSTSWGRKRMSKAATHRKCLLQQALCWSFTYGVQQIACRHLCQPPHG